MDPTPPKHTAAAGRILLWAQETKRGIGALKAKQQTSKARVGTLGLHPNIPEAEAEGLRVLRLTQTT